MRLVEVELRPLRPSQVARPHEDQGCEAERALGSAETLLGIYGSRPSRTETGQLIDTQRPANEAEPAGTFTTVTATGRIPRRNGQCLGPGQGETSVVALHAAHVSACL
jgi:hypothetical protein